VGRDRGPAWCHPAGSATPLWPLAGECATAQPLVTVHVAQQQGLSFSNMTVDLRRSRAELETLEAEISQWSVDGPANLNQWMHKLYALIGDVLDPNAALAIRLASVRNQSAVNAKRMLLEIIESLRWEVDRRMPTTDPFSGSTIDSELWVHVQGLIAAADWEKVAREAAVFVEDKLRQWAKVSSSVTGSVNVFKAAIGSNGFVLPKAAQSSEQQGWQQLATGFALALRNPSGHQINHRSDAERYALGVLGMASLLLTEVRHEYGDPPTP